MTEKAGLHVTSAHHGGCMWMTSLGAGLSWAAVSLLNNTSVRPFCSLEARWQSWWSSLRGGWRSQSASCMPHSSWTSSTSSTITPGLSTGEQSNNNTDVWSLHVCVQTVLTIISLGLHTQAKRFTFRVAFKKKKNRETINPKCFQFYLWETFSLNNKKRKVREANWDNAPET